MMSMSACATAPSSGQACPQLAEYSARQQIDAADELANLEEGAVLITFVEDYLQLRDRLRIVCR